MSTTAPAPPASHVSAGQGLQLIIFSLDGRDYALAVDDVAEIIRMVTVAPVPAAPEWLPGVIDLRGEVIPVADLRSRLGLEPVPPRLDTPILIARHGGRTFGLIADAVSDLLDVAHEDISPAETLAGNTPVKGVARTGDRLIMMLDLARIAGDVERFA